MGLPTKREMNLVALFDSLKNSWTFFRMFIIQFLLPSSHPNRIPHNKACGTLALSHIPSFDEVSNLVELPTNLENCQRTGCMAAFKRLEDFEHHFMEIMEIFDESPPSTPGTPDGGASDAEDEKEEDSKGMDGATASSFSEVRSCFVGEGHGKRQRVNEPIHILNVAIRYKSIVDDTLLSDTFTAFCLAKRAVLVERGIRRITFVVMFEHQHSKFFTYRSRDQFHEDRIYHHLEPALSFQLEINRLRTYELGALPTANQKMPLYLGKAKVAKGQEVTDYRFFIQSIIRHLDLITEEASFEYLQNEGDSAKIENDG